MIQTDLTRDKGWDSLKAHDLKWISLISVDSDWSAFALRPQRPGEPRQTFRWGQRPRSDLLAPLARPPFPRGAGVL